jgi:hypothetical protein
MSVKAILTTAVIIGSSSAALAAPAHFGERRGRVERVERREPQRVERREPARVERREPVRFERREPVRYEREWYRRPIIRDRYYYRSPTVVYEQAPIYAPSAFIDGRLSLSLGGRIGNAIELASNGGSTWVSEVVIEYADGRSATVPVNQYVDASNPRIDLPCEGCAVANIVVLGSGSGVSAYVI